MRQEKDLLGGGAEVPAGAMYGAQTQRAVENYPISGMRAATAQIRAIGMVKNAAAEANGELGVVSREQAEAIASAAQEVIDGEWDGEFVVDVFQAGAGVSFHMNANEVIANRANQVIAGERFKVQGSGFEGKTEEPGGGTKTNTGILRFAQNDNVESMERAALGKYEWVHPNDHVNYGQSTNDVFPTAMRLGTLLALEGLYPVLDALAGSFAAKGREFDGVVKAGRTHMQDATPIRLGQEFAAYGVAVRQGCGESFVAGGGGTARSWCWVGRRWGRGSIRIRCTGRWRLQSWWLSAGKDLRRLQTCGGRCSRVRRWRR